MSYHAVRERPYMAGVCCFLLSGIHMCIRNRGHDDNKHEESLKPVFGDWIRKAIAPGMENIDQMDYDLANLCALLFEGSQRPITDRVEGRRRAALDACNEFWEKYT